MVNRETNVQQVDNGNRVECDTGHKEAKETFLQLVSNIILKIFHTFNQM